MNNTKEKQARLQIIIAILVLTVIVFAEMYLMINFNDSYLAIIILAVVALAAVYVVVNAFMTLSAEKEAKREAHFENLYRSEKASYIMLKKSFDEIEDRLNELQESSKVPAEEIINAQKGIAKVIINRSKENADAIINSNDQVLERLDEVEETQNTKFTSLSKEQRLKLSDFGTQTELKLQDLLVQLKDTELRLNQAIMNGTKVVMPMPESYATPNDMSDVPGVEDFPLDELFGNATDVLEAADEFLVENNLEATDPFSMEDIFQINETEEFFAEEPVVAEEPVMEEPIVEAEPVVEPEPIVESEPVVEPVVEEKPPMPDLSDPNKALNPDEIAALFANMSGDSEPAPEPEPVVEEKPAMPDLSDPNKVMSPDEIAALIANL